MRSQTAQTSTEPQTDGFDPERVARLAAEYAADKKAMDLKVLDLRGAASYTDLFVICSGRNERQTKAIHDAVYEGLKRDHGVTPRRVEGLQEARWVLMDYIDVVVHIFVPEVRDFYRLEQLWGDMPHLEIDAAGESAQPAGETG